LDHIVWSDEKKKKEKGRMAIGDLKGTKDGCLGAKNQANAFTILFTSKTSHIIFHIVLGCVSFLTSVLWCVK
jgi:hypothetical protein